MKDNGHDWHYDHVSGVLFLHTYNIVFVFSCGIHFGGAIATPNEFVFGIDSTFPFKVSFHAKIMALFSSFYYVYIIAPLPKVW